MDYNEKNKVGFKIKILKIVKHVSKVMQVLNINIVVNIFYQICLQFSVLFIFSLVSASLFFWYFSAFINMNITIRIMGLHNLQSVSLRGI